MRPCLPLCFRLLDLFVVTESLLLHPFCIGEDLVDVLVVLLRIGRALLRVEGERVGDRLRCPCSDRQVPLGRHDPEVLDPVELAVEARELDLLEWSVVKLCSCEEGHHLHLSRAVVTSQDWSQ